MKIASFRSDMYSGFGRSLEIARLDGAEVGVLIICGGGVSNVLSARPLTTSTERAVILASGLLVLTTSGRSRSGLADIARRLQAWEVDPG